MQFMVESMHLKNWAAAGNNLQSLLEREDNRGHESAYEPLVLPTDDEGYVVGFRSDEAEEMVAFFEKYGLVVVIGVLPEPDCAASVRELWDFLERQVSGLDRGRPETWGKWTQLAGLGMLGNTFNVSPQLCANRQHPAIHKVFASLFGTEQLRVNVGRSSLMRPTVQIPMSDGRVVDRPDWRTKPGADWLHWDLNPLCAATRHQHCHH